MELPVIDVSPFVQAQGNEADKLAVAQALHVACRDVGFFYVIHHGIEESHLNQVLNISRAYFQQSDEIKAKDSVTLNDHSRGYQKLGQNVTSYARDYHEALDYYRPVDETSRSYLFEHPEKPLSGENRWPETPLAFSGVLKEHVEKMLRLGAAVMRAMAVSLALPESTFESLTNHSFWTMRVIHYPPLSARPKEAGDDYQQGISCGEHTDYGCLTFVLQDETRDALQVRTRQGDWISAHPMKNAFVVNIGDMFNIWTNGLYTSTRHRVVHLRGPSRVSVPFFFEPNFNAFIEPLLESNLVREAKLKQEKEIQEMQIAGKTLPLEWRLLREPRLFGHHLIGKVTKNFDFNAKK